MFTREETKLDPCPSLRWRRTSGRGRREFHASFSASLGMGGGRGCNRSRRRRKIGFDSGSSRSSWRGRRKVSPSRLCGRRLRGRRRECSGGLIRRRGRSNIRRRRRKIRRPRRSSWMRCSNRRNRSRSRISTRRRGTRRSSASRYSRRHDLLHGRLFCRSQHKLRRIQIISRGMNSSDIRGVLGQRVEQEENRVRQTSHSRCIDQQPSPFRRISRENFKEPMK